MSKYNYINEQLKEGFKDVFSKFYIIKESIQPKTNHDGRKYYEFSVKWSKKPNTVGKFEYWPDTKGWKKGYVEIYNDNFGIGDGAIIELAEYNLTQAMYNYHKKTLKAL